MLPRIITPCPAVSPDEQLANKPTESGLAWSKVTVVTEGLAAEPFICKLVALVAENEGEVLIVIGNLTINLACVVVDE